MPRRSILSAAERDNLLPMPDAKDELIRHYTFSETDLSIIVLGTCHQRLTQTRSTGRRYPFAILVAARLGAHQSDG
jgi:hypothetical protein